MVTTGGNEPTDNADLAALRDAVGDDDEYLAEVGVMVVCEV